METKTEAEALMTGVDPTTLTASAQALITEKSLLSDIQYSFYVALGINIVALLLSVFIKCVDTSKDAVIRLNSQGNKKMKTETI